MQNNGNKGKKRGELRSMLGKQTGKYGNTDPLFPQETIQLINLTNGHYPLVKRICLIIAYKQDQ
jgi:hypothetical protein